MPHALGVTLSLAKFNQIVKVDPVARTAVVQTGVRNAAISAATAWPAFCTSSKLARIARASTGLGSSLTVTSSVTASMPSEPITADSRSRPGASSASEPKLTGSPSAVNPRTRSTLCTVNPYFRQCMPPEFSATLPPMEQAI